jgi:hypothetical protein
MCDMFRQTNSFIARSHWAECNFVCFPNTKVAGTPHLIPNAPRTRRMPSERFPYTPYVPRMLPNTSRIYLQATFGRSMKFILNMRNTFVEQPNAVSYAPVRNRTASMLLEYTECFPNTVSSLPEHQNLYSENIRNGRMAFRLFSEYESGAIFETVRIFYRMCLPQMVSE